MPPRQPKPSQTMKPKKIETEKTLVDLANDAISAAFEKVGLGFESPTKEMRQSAFHLLTALILKGLLPPRQKRVKLMDDCLSAKLESEFKLSSPNYDFGGKFNDFVSAVKQNITNTARDISAKQRL